MDRAKSERPKGYRLTREQIEQIERAVAREERVEIIPTKYGPAIYRIKRTKIDSSSL